MKYGLYLPNFGVFGDACVLADLAATAEQAGWHGFFLWDHIAQDETVTGMVDPWVALAAIAMNTTTIRIGTTVTPLPRRRPWKLARETVSIDHLSGGRLILGVGIGVGAAEWDHFGETTDLRQRGEMLDEGLDILMGLWSGESFSFSGTHYQIKQAHFLPTPVQQPRIPIWVGGFWPNRSPFKRMARWDGMFPLFAADPPDIPPLFSEAVSYVKSERETAGNDGPYDVIYMSSTLGVDATTASARVQAAAAAGATWWLEILMPEIYGFGPADPAALEAIRDRVLQGPPGD